MGKQGQDLRVPVGENVKRSRSVTVGKQGQDL